MEDEDVSDVEELLDEIESTLSNNLVVKPKVTKSLVKQNAKELSPDSELDQMIADIIEDPDIDDKVEMHHSKPISVSNKPQTSEKKCFPCLLGGSIHARGLSTSIEQRSCDRLLCTKCDFKVVSFDDYHWSTDCDYLFFRNNAPDFSRLRAKLIKKKGIRSYACQCSWKSIREVTNVNSLFDIKWTCSKH